MFNQPRRLPLLWRLASRLLANKPWWRTLVRRTWGGAWLEMEVWDACYLSNECHDDRCLAPRRYWTFLTKHEVQYLTNRLLTDTISAHDATYPIELRGYCTYARVRRLESLPGAEVLP
jgi:hypothetical protein